MVKTIQNRIVYELTDLKGISDKKAQKLRDVGIFSTDDLTKKSNLQQRKLKEKFTGGLLDRLISINNRGNLRDRDVTKAAIEERKKIRERKQAEIESGESPTDVGFASATRSREEFEQAFDAFKSEFDSRSVPVAEMGRAIDTEGTAQPLINAATSRVTFASASQPADFETELEDQTEKIERKDRRTPATPGEQRDSFVSFVEQEIGFGGGTTTVGEFEVSTSDQEEAREAYAEQSPEAKQVDSRRRAPITTDADQYERRPGELDFPGIDTPSESPQVKAKDRNTVDADETTLEENTGSLFIRENRTSGGTIGSLKGLFSGGRSPGRGVTGQAEQVAQEDLGANTDKPSGGSAVADIMFLERDKDGFGEDLIPFGAEESDRNSFEF